MKIMKRITALVGIVAISASTLLVGGASAQTAGQIGTTITVQDTTQVCADTRATSLGVSHFQGDPYPYGTLTRNSSSGFHNAIRPTQQFTMDLYVNTCLDQAWRVNASITDWSDGSNTIPAANTMTAYATSSGTALPVFKSANTQFTVANQVPGTSGLPLGAGTYFGPAFTVSPGGATLQQTVSTGTAAVSEGEMVQVFRLQLLNIPNTAAPGTYTSTLTLTFTSPHP